MRLYLDTCSNFVEKQVAARAILEECDENKDGYIDFEEFRHIVSTVQRKNEKPPTNEELLFAFEQFDTDGNHLICYRQFWRQIKALDPSINRREADLIFNEIDKDKDGYIDFGEFVRYLDFSNQYHP